MNKALKNTDTLAAFIARKAEIDTILARLAALSAEHFSCTPDEITWTDVGTLFNADFGVLLYDLTSAYLEINAANVPAADKRRHGHSRNKRPDCPQVVIALVVTPD